jgi:hypothetical protein
MTIDDIVEQAKTLTQAEREELIQRLHALPVVPEPEEEYSILDLAGLGKKIWQDVDAQEYVNELRDEWDHRS